MSPYHVSPVNFYRAFRKVVDEKKPAVLAAWPSNPELTRVMRSDVFPEVAAQLDLQCYGRDYYTLDAVFYRERDTENFPAESTYAKCISVALEHENDRGTAHVEMKKLQILNAPLKVLITYPNGPVDSDTLLAQYAGIISAADIFNDISTLRRQSVIFGSSVGPKWQGFVYTDGRFRSIEEDAFGDRALK